MTPLFSVVTAVFNPVAEHLDRCIASVARQPEVADGDIEHLLVDDASTDPAVGEALAAADKASHVRVVTQPSNGGIVAASTTGVDRASGQWVVLLDHDDELAEGALATLAAAMAEHPQASVIYSDHDLIRPDGRRADPVYKPDFSPERLRQTNYITHLVAVRRDAVNGVGGFRPGTDGAQDHDLLLRLVEAGHQFVHVPELLLHWRQSPASVATDVANKPGAFDAGRMVVAEHLERCGVDATVALGEHAGMYRIHRSLADEPLVSVVIPTNGTMGQAWGVDRTFVVDAVTSMIDRSAHRNLEFVVVADTTMPPQAEAALRSVVHAAEINMNIVEFDEPFNFSRKINVGAEAASGDLLLLMNDDTELIEPSSVSSMVAHLVGHDALRANYGDVGAVGARLLYADGTLQHGGHVYHGEFMHAFIGWAGEHPGPQRMLAIDRECSGVTAAALMTTRAVFDDVGGFPEDLPLHFNDVDFCVSVRESGRRILWTPHASWYHFEGKTRSRGATMAEWARVADRWPSGEPEDPYANPNLVRKRADWLELPGRSGAPPYEFAPDGSKIWG